jgi:hypothetical protein
MCCSHASTRRENIVWSQILYATMLLIQKFQILSGKKCWNKFVDVHKMCPHNSYKFQNQIRNVLRETKKTNCYVNSIILTFCLFVTLFMFDFSFLFLLVYFEFGFENSRDCKDIFAIYILKFWKWYHSSILGRGSLDMYPHPTILFMFLVLILGRRGHTCSDSCDLFFAELG